ncbi:hypothetical protein GCM10011611_29760 [Aliidongia dinghuensis]|uniref:Uncharacterized protein n=1 Tax=Aliidongia dinghuensis TaxID=1867774 RepID=A0A8J2YVH8_9PROT|nr:hypothetical protein [Aliidongia dinghuensis]GGF21736.1 hypothetical protein GCM10011611_29760 [Aliidongia dinghuensis]
MPKCKIAGCGQDALVAKRSPYCFRHVVLQANVVTPPEPMKTQVMSALEWEREEAAMQTRGRSSAVTRRVPDQGPQSANFYGRMRIAHAAALAAKKTEPELLKPVLAAFNDVKSTATFDKYLGEETTWKSLDYFVRAAAPAIMMRPIAEEVRDALREKALLAGKSDHPFADRYFFELSLYCDAFIQKQDIDFVFSQASLVLGPLLAPVYAAAAVAGPVVQHGVKSAPSAVKFGVKKAVETKPETMASVQLPQATGAMASIGRALGQVKRVDPMRFTIAWLNFVTRESEPAAPITTIVTEFGGTQACVTLRDWLKSQLI